MLPHIPEPEQGNTKSQAPIRIRNLKEPVESRAKVLDLLIASNEPRSAIRGIQFRIPFLRQNQKVCRLGAACYRFLSTCDKALMSIFTDRLKHSEAWLRLCTVSALNEILID